MGFSYKERFSIDGYVSEERYERPQGSQALKHCQRIKMSGHD